MMFIIGTGSTRRIHPAQVAIERNLQGVGRGPRAGHGDRQDRIGAQLSLVLRAVQRNHGGIDQALVGRIHARQFGGHHALHIFYGVQHSLAQVMRLVAVAQLHGLVLAGGGPAGYSRPAHGSAREKHIGFYRGIPAGIQNLARVNGNNLGHITPCNAVL